MDTTRSTAKVISSKSATLQNTKHDLAKLVAEESRRLASAPEGSLIVRLANAVERLGNPQQLETPYMKRKMSHTLALIAYGISPLFSAEAYLGLTPCLWKTRQDADVDKAVKGLGSVVMYELDNARKARSDQDDRSFKAHALRAKLSQLLINACVEQASGGSSGEKALQEIDKWVKLGVEAGITLGKDDTANKGEGTLLEAYKSNVGIVLSQIEVDKEISLFFLCIDD